jgi:hypothetical protein
MTFGVVKETEYETRAYIPPSFLRQVMRSGVDQDDVAS